jgi:NAD(P)-dependent dehydrogenase (short-subunit alcohol dehydrogenase family)
MCTASNAGLYSFPMAPLYAATKHGVVGLVRSLSRTLATKQIRINGLAPAVIGKPGDSRFALFTNKEQKQTLLLVLICSSR